MVHFRHNPTFNGKGWVVIINFIKHHNKTMAKSDHIWELFTGIYFQIFVILLDRQKFARFGEKCLKGKSFLRKFSTVWPNCYWCQILSTRDWDENTPEREQNPETNLSNWKETFVWAISLNSRMTHQPRLLSTALTDIDSEQTQLCVCGRDL